MSLFEPKKVYFEPAALDYPLGDQLFKEFKKQNIPVQFTDSHNRVMGIKGKTQQEQYIKAKETLVVGIKKDMNFETCKPSAHYQFPIATGCPGHCEYCYLQTSLGKKPYIRIYVNLEEIFQSIKKHIEKHLPQTTVFEASSSADPLALEHLTGSLAKTIIFFGGLDHGKLRFVTKFTNVDSLLDLPHNDNTRFRFSINSNYVINNFEHNTPAVIERIKAAKKVLQAGYPLGFIIAPIMTHPGWKDEYNDLFNTLAQNIDPKDKEITFELITHRFTSSAKKLILERFPHTKLDMVEENRQIKFGKFGRSKFVYKKEEMTEIKDFISTKINNLFPKSRIEYFT